MGVFRRSTGCRVVCRMALRQAEIRMELWELEIGAKVGACWYGKDEGKEKLREMTQNSAIWKQRDTVATWR
jgi:hypothetical protein